MRTGYLAGGVVLLALSLVCIVTTVVGMAAGQYGMGARRAIAAYVFHPVTGLAGLACLFKAVPRRAPAAGDDEEPEQEELP